MRKQKFLALLLALVMVLSLVPVAAFAAEGDTSTETTQKDGIELDKSVTLQSDGTYTINLSAYSTGSTVEEITEINAPLDIVLVLDQSGSMDSDFGTSNMYGALGAGVTNEEAYDYASSGYLYVLVNGSYQKVTMSRKATTEGFFGWGANYSYTYTASGMTSTTTADDANDAVSPWAGSLYAMAETKHDALVIAANGFIQSVFEDAVENDLDHRMAIVGFASTRENHGWLWTENYYYTNTELLSTADEVNYEAVDGLNGDDATTVAGYYQDALVYVNSDNAVNSRLTTAVSRLGTDGDTYSEYGIDLANKIFENNSISGNRKRIVIVFTDGYTAPSGTNDFKYEMANNAISNAKVSKNTYNASVYTIAVVDGADPTADITTNFATSDGWSGSSNNLSDAQEITALNRYMHYTSSNYPSAESLQSGGTRVDDSNYYLTATDTVSLNKVFDDVFDQELRPSTSVTLDSKSVMKDIIGTNFTLPANYTTATNSEGKPLYYTVNVKTVTEAVDGSHTFTENNDAAEQELEAAVKVSVSGQDVNITGFDYSANYVSYGKTGYQLIVTLNGIEQSADAPVNEIFDTNGENSGVYAWDYETNQVSSEASMTFEQPKAVVTGETYVVDYAKPITVASSDWMQSAITKMGTSESDYGTYAQSGNNVTYTPKSTNWDGYDYAMILGTPNDTFKSTYSGATANGSYVWSKVNVIPANNVYYEDTFKDATSGGAAGTVGIVYTGSWTEGTAGSNTEDANGSIAGWVKDLSDDADYSDGSAQVGTYSDSNTATAKFTFTGTGVDIYSRTNLYSGKVFAFLRKVDGDTEINKQMLLVDNLAVSGDYYNVPTLTFQDLPYGTYSVEIVVNRAYAVDANGDIIDEETYRSTYYLDGIRVYNPLGSASDDDTKIDEVVNEAYNGQIETAFKEVRDLLVNADNTADTTNTGNAVFIDHNLDEDEVAYKAVVYEETDVYNNYGPKNEVYLAPGQSIVFAVEGADNYYIGLKSLKGTEATVNAEFSNGEGNSVASISHTTDLYYKVVPSTVDGVNYITVSNTTEVAEGGEEPILAVTKLQMTSGVVGQVMSLRAISDEEAVAEVAAFSLRSTAAYSAEPEEETPEETTPEETTPEETPSEPEVPDIDVEIENPEPTPEQKPAQNEALKNLVKNLFNKILGWFGR